MVKFGFGVKSLKALPRFFAYRNDIDIYTEDKVSDKEFYRTLFQRLLGDKFVINDVTPLGCKKNVLDAFNSQDTKTKRNRYYIVDGDLDLILDTNPKSKDNLIVLDSYCIENYIVDEVGAIELLYYSNGKDDRGTIKKRLDFDKWLSSNQEALIDLFLNFAILKKHGGGPKLDHATSFLKQEKKETILDCGSVKNYSASIKKQIIDILSNQGNNQPENTYKEDYNRLSSIWRKSNNTLLEIVSGKDYLIPLLQFRVNYCRNKGKTLFQNESIKLFLANNCDLKRLQFLRKRIK